MNIEYVPTEILKFDVTWTQDCEMDWTQELHECTRSFLKISTGNDPAESIKT